MHEHIKSAAVLAGRVEHMALLQQSENHARLALTGRLKAHGELDELPLDPQAMEVELICLRRPRDWPVLYLHGGFWARKPTLERPGVLKLTCKQSVELLRVGIRPPRADLLADTPATQRPCAPRIGRATHVRIVRDRRGPSG